VQWNRLTMDGNHRVRRATQWILILSACVLVGIVLVRKAPKGPGSPTIDRDHLPEWPWTGAAMPAGTEGSVADHSSPSLERSPAADGVHQLVVRVADKKQSPVPGARVTWRLASPSSVSTLPDLRPTLLTDDLGEVHLEVPEPGPLALQVFRPGYLTYRGLHDVRTGDAIHVELDAGLGFRGRVVTHANKPVPGTVVVFVPMRVSGHGFPPLSKITAACNEGGYFVCAGLLAGDYQFLASAPGYVLCATGSHVVQPRDEPIGGFLDRLMGVRLRFTDQSGETLNLPASAIMRTGVDGGLRWKACQVMPSDHALTARGLEMARCGELLVGRIAAEGLCVDVPESSLPAQWMLPWGEHSATLRVRPVLDAIEYEQVSVIALPTGWRSQRVRVMPFMDDRLKDAPGLEAHMGLTVEGAGSVSYTCVPGRVARIVLAEGARTVSVGIDRFSGRQVVDVASCIVDGEGAVVIPYRIERACVLRVTDAMGGALSSYVIRSLRGTSDATEDVQLSGIMVDQEEDPIVLWNYPAGSYELVCVSSGLVGTERFEMRDHDVTVVTCRL
jgi:hypothetical protein